MDAVLDLISTPASASAVDELATLVRPGGILLNTNGAADAEALAGHGIRADNFYSSSSPELLTALADLARSGKLRVRIDTQVPLSQAPAAIAAARTGHARGKTVIIPDGA